MKTLKQVWAALLLLVLWAGSVPAHAALAIIVHPSNNLSGISADEAADIYLAKAGVFSNGKRAIPVDQAASSPVRKKFYSAVIKKDDSTLKVYWSKLMFTGKANPPREFGDDAAVKSWVAGNPDAIGYVDGKFVDSSVKVLLIIP
ncbi:phosphate ABC transporter substrate-binding protein [Sulfuricaulis limicola]|uniref:Phosphate ABC transporter substrate-binding protein n=1 Tax=Sulfuricaulis limicola TaxID=1620215 RepID=A0A1B4XDH9_9GAMM|nr:phosphate ABC transporter substrate-binding protein [Sulfuricaulis limicola]BAV32852.1 phosphate ABC transporter substrate-binding protein [Sulfuricaulis limicola]